MKLFIDSSQKMFIALLINDKNKVIYKSTIETKYKVEEIVNFFDGIDCFNQIKDIYINLGPGSFTGSRIALLYVRTMAQINNQISIYTCSTYDLLKKQSSKLKSSFYIEATKNKSYLLKKNKIEVANKHHKEVRIDYDDISNNFDKYITLFKKTDLIELKPIYASEPQIGGNN